MSNQLVRTTSLFLSDPSVRADKEYHVYLRKAGDDAFTVDFAYGRRGSALSAGTKTATPVARDKAEAIEKKLVAEKKAKGYVACEIGKREVGTDTGEASGYLPQLLNTVDRTDLEEMAAISAFCFQQKMDGERRLVLVEGTQVRGINRRGEFVGVPVEWQGPLGSLGRLALIDGEQIGGRLFAFDLLIDGEDLRDASFEDRHARLTALLASVDAPELFQLVPVATTEEAKCALVTRLEAANAEGVVARRLDAPYRAGRPNSGGDALKHKFWESATVIVLGESGDKRSVRMGLLDAAGALVYVGKVSIPPNAGVPAENTLIEVRYLYRASEDGALYQPTFIGVRSDVSRGDATLLQITRTKPANGQLSLLAA